MLYGKDQDKDKERTFLGCGDISSGPRIFKRLSRITVAHLVVVIKVGECITPLMSSQRWKYECVCDLTLLIRVGGVSAALLWGWLWGTGTRAHFNLGPGATAASAAVCIMNKTSLWPLSGVYWTVQPCLPLCPSLPLSLIVPHMCTATSANSCIVFCSFVRHWSAFNDKSGCEKSLFLCHECCFVCACI